MARPQATPEQRAELRKRIQRAAAEIYNQEGITAISARAVAKGAGVSVGTIYAHFDGLPELMRSLWTGHVERFEVTLRELAAGEPDPVKRVAALLTAYIEFGLANSELYRGVFMFVRPAGLERPEQAALDSAAIWELLEEAIKEGQDQAEFAAGDPKRLAQILWSGVHGCLALPVNFDDFGLATAKQTGSKTVDLLVKAIRR